MAYLYIASVKILSKTMFPKKWNNERTPRSLHHSHRAGASSKAARSGIKRSTLCCIGLIQSRCTWTSEITFRLYPLLLNIFIRLWRVRRIILCWLWKSSRLSVTKTGIKLLLSVLLLADIRQPCVTRLCGDNSSRCTWISSR